MLSFYIYINSIYRPLGCNLLYSCKLPPRLTHTYLLLLFNTILTCTLFTSTIPSFHILVISTPSHPIPSHPAPSNPISYPIVYPIVISYRISYPILSYPILSYPILSYPILSYPILPYSILSLRNRKWRSVFI